MTFHFRAFATRPGAYLCKMTMDGIIVNPDTTYLEKQFFEVHNIGVNINQLARLA